MKEQWFPDRFSGKCHSNKMYSQSVCDVYDGDDVTDVT